MQFSLFSRNWLKPQQTKMQRKRLLWVCTVLLSISMSALAQQEPDAELREILKRTVNDSSSFVDRFDAEVWLVDMNSRLKRYIKNPEQRLKLLKLVHAEARRAELEPELVLSLIHVESAFDRFAISYVGAQGLMQVMPFWKDEIGRPEDNLTHNATNFQYGCRILQFYLKREKGDLHKGLARYNGSVGRRTYSNKVYRAWVDRWRNGPLDWSEK